MRSMTGFGAGISSLGEGRLTVELRSLNHKNQDVRMRMPSELADHSSFFEQMARKTLARGRYDISIRIEGEVGASPHVAIDKLRALYSSLVDLRDSIAPGTELSLTSLLHLPELVVSPGPEVQAARQALTDAFTIAHTQLNEMRAKEGDTLLSDIKLRLGQVKSLRERIVESAVQLVEHHRTRLEERLTQLLGDSSLPHSTPQLSQGRLEQEVALVADRSDITEELVRLESHFSQLESLCANDEPVGRRLDFLLQEVGREINTIGSKSQFAPVAHLVVDMKSEVERLREQVQNVE